MSRTIAHAPARVAAAKASPSERLEFHVSTCVNATEEQMGDLITLMNVDRDDEVGAARSLAAFRVGTALGEDEVHNFRHLIEEMEKEILEHGVPFPRSVECSIDEKDRTAHGCFYYYPDQTLTKHVPHSRDAYTADMASRKGTREKRRHEDRALLSAIRAGVDPEEASV